MSNTVRTVLVLVITAVWATSYLAPIFVARYTPPSEVHVVFMVIVSVLASGYRRREPPPPPPL